MKLFICITVFSLLSANLRAQQSFSITGNVKDENGAPLQLVTVFIDGSNRYTATDANGHYSFTTIETGTYRLATSMVGRGSERLTIILRDKSVNINFVMKKTPIELKGVVIGTDSRRPEMLRLFINKFIGTTKNAQSCTIINPNIIEFTSNKNILLATTPDFLIIENKNLGYRIKYLVKIFRHDKSLNLTSYTGDCIFEELSGTYKQKKQWLANRDDVYRGSFMQYLRSLYVADSHQRWFRNYVITDSLNSSAINTDPLDMTKYVTRIDSNFIKLAFKQTLKVAYREDKVKTISGKWGEPLSEVLKRANVKRAKLDLNSSSAKVSTVKLYLDNTIVDRNGNYSDYRSFLLEGLWSNLQVGDRLPFTFWPEVE